MIHRSSIRQHLINILYREHQQKHFYYEEFFVVDLYGTPEKNTWLVLSQKSRTEQFRDQWLNKNHDKNK